MDRMEKNDDPGAERDSPSATALEEVYEELRTLARQWMSRERPDHTLQPTAIVHEAYLRVVNYNGGTWNSRGQFIAVASIAIRRFLVDYARRKMRQRRGGDRERVLLTEPPVDLHRGSESGCSDVDLIDLDEALDELARLHSRQGRIVELRFFGGLTHEEIAELLCVTSRTVHADWNMARRWLRRRLADKSSS